MIIMNSDNLTCFRWIFEIEFLKSFPIYYNLNNKHKISKGILLLYLKKLSGFETHELFYLVWLVNPLRYVNINSVKFEHVCGWLSHLNRNYPTSTTLTLWKIWAFLLMVYINLFIINCDIWAFTFEFTYNDILQLNFFWRIYEGIIQHWLLLYIWNILIFPRSLKQVHTHIYMYRLMKS